jgi:hypothetical protein
MKHAGIIGIMCARYSEFAIHTDLSRLLSAINTEKAPTFRYDLAENLKSDSKLKNILYTLRKMSVSFRKKYHTS